MIENTKKLDFADAIQKTKKFIDNYSKEESVPGMSIAIGLRNKIICSEAVGYSNLEKKIPATTKTKFRIGSVSKPLTIAALAVLYQKGLVDFLAPIQKYVPTFPVKKWTINLRDLACHMGGIRHYHENESRTLTSETIKDGLSIFMNDPLINQPNTEFSYSSYGYNLIGAAIENIAEEEFAVFTRKEVFEPLKMTNTLAENRKMDIPERTSFYGLDENGRVIQANDFAIEFKIPSGGFLSTAEDLVTFGLNCLQPGFFSKEVLNLFFTPQKNKEGKDFEMGIGWMISPDTKGRMRYGHLGGVQGGCSMLVIFPETELVVAFNGNRDTDWSDEPTQTIAEYFLEIIEKG